MQAAFPLFPDTDASPPTLALSSYFDDTRVEALIAVYDEKGGADPSSYSTTIPSFGSVDGRSEDWKSFSRLRGGGGAAAVAAAVESAAASAVGGVRAAVVDAAGVVEAEVIARPKKALVFFAGLSIAAFGVVATLGSALLGSSSPHAAPSATRGAASASTTSSDYRYSHDGVTAGSMSSGIADALLPLHHTAGSVGMSRTHSLLPAIVQWNRCAGAAYPAAATSRHNHNNFPRALPL